MNKVLDPVRIYQSNLDAVSDAVWRGDLQLILQHIGLPNQMLTEDAEIVIASADEMFVLMTDFREALRGLGADEYRRVCQSARFLPGHDWIIQGSHVTHVRRDGQDLRPPYRNDMTLVRNGDGRWLAIRVEASTKNAHPAVISPDMAAAQLRDLTRLAEQFRTPWSPDLKA